MPWMVEEWLMNPKYTTSQASALVKEATFVSACTISAELVCVSLRLPTTDPNSSPGIRLEAECRERTQTAESDSRLRGGFRRGPNSRRASPPNYYTNRIPLLVYRGTGLLPGMVWGNQ